eukprot:1154164-Amphidinium_carterae.2
MLWNGILSAHLACERAATHTPKESHVDKGLMFSHIPPPKTIDWHKNKQWALSETPHPSTFKRLHA